jgi:hypothetical protein
MINKTVGIMIIEYPTTGLGATSKMSFVLLIIPLANRHV